MEAVAVIFKRIVVGEVVECANDPDAKKAACFTKEPSILWAKRMS